MRMRYWLLPILTALLAPTPAWAAEGLEKGGLMEPKIAVIVTAIGIFFILLFVLTKLAWKPILKGLQQREDTIRQAVDDAQKANEDARALAAEYQQKLDEARGEARAIAEQARKDADATRMRIEQESRTQAEETLARAVRDIGQAKDSAYAELLADVTTLATEAASRILQRELSPEDNAALVDGVIEDFARSREGGSA